MRPRIIVLGLAVLGGLFTGSLVFYCMPPFPLYGAWSLRNEAFWMAGQVNPPGKCGFTFTAEGPEGYNPAALEAFTVPPEFSPGPGMMTSGGVLFEQPTDIPAGSYVVVFGLPISVGWCEDEQGRRYKPVWSTIVLRNPTVLPDPGLRRILALAATAGTGLLVFALGFPVNRRPSPPADSASLLIPDS